MFYGKLTRTTIPKILSVSPLTTKEHPYKVKKSRQGSFFIICEKVDFLVFHSASVKYTTVLAYNLGVSAFILNVLQCLPKKPPKKKFKGNNRFFFVCTANAHAWM